MEPERIHRLTAAKDSRRWSSVVSLLTGHSRPHSIFSTTEHRLAKRLYIMSGHFLLVKPKYLISPFQHYISSRMFMLLLFLTAFRRQLYVKWTHEQIKWLNDLKPFWQTLIWWSTSHSLTWRGLGLWATLRSTTRGRSRWFGFIITCVSII